MKKIVVFTGAGISAESGIKTFRDSGGLWEEYDINEVATPQGFQKNPELVLDFYNQRRKQVVNASPNAAHKALAELEKKFDVQIVTQNIDDLHERAGSKKVLHLHGEIMKSKSTRFPELIYDVKNNEIKMGELCEKGFQLRPHIVWFGEMVPMMEPAIDMVSNCDVLIVIGTSLDVYPAAGLVNYASEDAKKYLVDPKAKRLPYISNLELMETTAGEGVPLLVKTLLGGQVIE
ncbi:MAG TPA: NAD-dependent deacylase [Bacteroidia bacterium]|nr:NAD-dependent deacylase [Bacteroidia bacterium]